MSEFCRGYIEPHVTQCTEPNGVEFELEFSGAELATTALILVHGFGARRDSRGLFTEIAEASKSTALTVRPDFSIVEGDTSIALPFSQQVSRLRSVLRYCSEELDIQRHILVGHSQGWLPIALSNSYAKSVLALAPPLGNAFEAFINTPGWTRRGSELNLEGQSRLVRSDGSLTLVPKEFWDQFKALGNVTPEMQRLARRSDTTIYFAGDDNVLGAQETPKSLRASTVEAANHDFVGTPRQALISKMMQDLQLNLS